MFVSLRKCTESNRLGEACFKGMKLTIAAKTAWMEDRFGEAQLPAAVVLEFSTMTQKYEETIKQWGDRTFDVAKLVFGPDIAPEVLQN